MISKFVRFPGIKIPYLIPEFTLDITTQLNEKFWWRCALKTLLSVCFEMRKFKIGAKSGGDIWIICIGQYVLSMFQVQSIYKTDFDFSLWRMEVRTAGPLLVRSTLVRNNSLKQSLTSKTLLISSISALEGNITLQTLHLELFASAGSGHFSINS